MDLFDQYYSRNFDPMLKRFLKSKDDIDIIVLRKFINQHLPYIVKINTSESSTDMWYWISENLTQYWTTIWDEHEYNNVNRKVCICFQSSEDALRFRLRF